MSEVTIGAIDAIDAAALRIVRYPARILREVAAPLPAPLRGVRGAVGAGDRDQPHVRERFRAQRQRARWQERRRAARRRRDGRYPARPDDRGKHHRLGARVRLCGLDASNSNAYPVPCTVLDPFCGAGTTGLVCRALGRSFIGCEVNPAYAEMAMDRIRTGEDVREKPAHAPGDAGLFAGAAS